MRKLLLTLAAIAVFGLALPASTTPAEARKGHHGYSHKKQVKVHHNRGRHLGWHKRKNHPQYRRHSGYRW